MKIKFCALLVGASLLALAGSGNAAQPLTEGQMEGITAGANFLSNATAAGAAFGNLDATVATYTNSYTAQKDLVLGFGIAIGQSYSTGEASSAITNSYLSVGASSVAACTASC